MSKALKARDPKLLLASREALAAMGDAAGAFQRVEIEPGRVPLEWAVIGISSKVPMVILAGPGRGERGPWHLSVGAREVRRLAEVGCPLEGILPTVEDPSSEQRATMLAALMEQALAAVPALVAGPTLEREVVCEAWIGQLVRDITHEFNNLLGGVMGLMEVARSMSDNPESDKVLETAINKVHEFSGIVRTLLEIGRCTIPERELVLPEVPIRKAVDLLSHRLKRKHIQTEYEIGAPPLINIDAALGTLMFARIIALLWDPAEDGDLLRIQVDRDEPTGGALYVLTMLKTEASSPPGSYWQDPRPRIFDEPADSPELDKSCLADIAALHGATLTGPETEEGVSTTFRAVFPCAESHRKQTRPNGP